MRAFLMLLAVWAAPMEAVRRFESPRGHAQTAVVYDGRLCVLGGHLETKAFDRFLCRTAPGEWTAMPRMQSGRSSAAAAVLGGRLYALGGGDPWPREYPEGESFDGRWRKMGAALEPRIGQGAAVVGDRIYLVGGSYEADPPRREHTVPHAELFWFSPGKGWGRAAPMPTARATPVVAVVGGRILVAGGITTGSKMSGALEAYDPKADRWERLLALPAARTDPSGGAIGSKLYVAGGNVGGMCSSALQVFDVGTGAWSQGPQMSRPRCNATAAVFEGRLYVIGGSDTSGRLYDEVEVFDPVRDEWTTEGLGQAAAVAERRPAPPAGPRELDLAGPRRRDGGKDLALVIGVDGYRALPAAEFAERDADSFAAALRGPLGLPEENIVRLTGSRATRTDIAKYVEEWLPRNVEADSRVYFYFSGHGAPDPKSGAAHLVPWDGDATFLQSSAYPLERLYANLAKLPAREVIVVLDSCFSGAGGRSVLAAGTRPLVTRTALPRPKGGRLSILTASAGDEITGSLSGGGHGLFTYHLLQGLGGSADKDGDGHVRLLELHGFVKREVRKAARRQNREQTPQLIAPDPALPVY